MIAAAAIPTVEPCIRAQLHHAMRHYRSRVSVTMSACSDHRIYILNIILLGWQFNRSKKENGEEESGYFFHVNRFMQDKAY